MQNASATNNLSNFNRRLFADQVHKQYDSTILGTMATLINSIILVFILRSHVPQMQLLVWLACAGIVSACRLVLHWSYRKSPTQYSNPEKWNAWFITTLFLSDFSKKIDAWNQ